MHSTTCFNAIHTAALSELRTLVRAHFLRYGAAALRDHVDVLIEGVVERCRTETASRIAWALELEDPPFTNNDEYFAGFREKYLTRYKDARKVRTQIFVLSAKNIRADFFLPCREFARRACLRTRISTRS